MDTFDALVQRARRPSDGAPPGPLFRMVFQPTHGPDALVGAVQGSADSVGRAYPFLVARPTRRAVLLAPDAPDWPLWWTETADDAALVVVGAVQRGATVRQVEERADAIAPLAEADARAERVKLFWDRAGHLPASDLWWRTWGTTDPGRAALLLGRLAAAFRRSGVPSYGIRFPLPPQALDFDHADSVSLWLRICTTLSASKRSTPTIFWHSDGIYQSGSLILFPSGVTPRSLSAVLSGAAAPDLISEIDAGSEAVAARAMSGLPTSFARLLSDPGTTSATLLQHIAALT